MESSGVCKSCKKRTLASDNDTGNLVCVSCGIVQDYDNFQAHIGDFTGPTGNYVRVGTFGSGSHYSYKEAKVCDAQKIIEDFMFKLGLSGSRCDEVKAMVEKVTEGEYGAGRWFPIFVGACAYVVMRKDKKPLSIVEVADLVGCDSNELGRMINRVLDFLELKLPEFDIVSSFERAIRSSPTFSQLSEEARAVMSKQGVFLIQCSMKWYLTTGRRPMPIVAAILVFVAELNKVKVKIGEVSKELHVKLRTCKMRYSELLNRLVKVAQALPWGKDITVKNILRNAPSVIQYMELKCNSNCNGKRSFEDARFDIDDLIADCLKEGTTYESNVNEDDFKYFEVGNSPNLRIEGQDAIQISHESLALIRSNLLDEFSTAKSTGSIGEDNSTRQKRRYDIHECREWWTGKSEMSRKLLLKQILEKDIGLDADPPSFDKGQLAYQRRREKISAAKSRIQKIMHPSEANPHKGNSHTLPEPVSANKKRKLHCEIDWEDFIIETLVLHQVREEEIEKGYYNALLDLYVFNDLD